MPRLVPASHQTIVSCSGRALYRPRTKPSPVVVAVPCAGLAQVIPQARRDARSSVRKRRTSERLSMLCLSTYVNDRIRLGCSLVRTLERASQLLGGIIACVTYYSLVLACEAGTRRGHYSGYSLIIFGCGRSNERPYRWEAVYYKAGGGPLCPSAVGGTRARCPFICTHPTQSNRTQVGTHRGASTSRCPPSRYPIFTHANRRARHVYVRWVFSACLPSPHCIWQSKMIFVYNSQFYIKSV